MGDVVYTSRIGIERVRGPLRYLDLPAQDERVAVGVHGPVAEHYGVSMDDHDPHPTTLDYVVAAAGG